jgi:biopolymer transport protein ExbD
MKRKRRSAEDAEINITPMLDIVFILLIFFIVTTSFVRESGIAMNRASNSPTETEDSSEAIFVRIENDGQIYIRNRRTDIRLVHANIQSSLAEKPGAPVVIAVSRKSDAGILVRVVDQARVAGAGQVSMVALTEPL